MNEELRSAVMRTLEQDRSLISVGLYVEESPKEGSLVGSGFVVRQRNDLFLVTAGHVAVDIEKAAVHGFGAVNGHPIEQLGHADLLNMELDLAAYRITDAPAGIKIWRCSELPEEPLQWDECWFFANGFPWFRSTSYSGQVNSKTLPILTPGVEICSSMRDRGGYRSHSHIAVDYRNRVRTVDGRERDLKIEMRGSIGDRYPHSTSGALLMSVDLDPSNPSPVPAGALIEHFTARDKQRLVAVHASIVRKMLEGG